MTGENPDKLQSDKELMNWIKQLNAPISQAGSGIKVCIFYFFSLLNRLTKKMLLVMYNFMTYER